MYGVDFVPLNSRRKDDMQSSLWNLHKKVTTINTP